MDEIKPGDVEDVEDVKVPEAEAAVASEPERDEPEPDIVKVDEGEAAAAEAKPDPKKKGSLKLRVVLLEGKNLDLEEKVHTEITGAPRKLLFGLFMKYTALSF
jgi:hypothetical protein